MGQYDKLDAVIVERVRAMGAATLIPLSGGEVCDEARLLAAHTGREDFRIIDGRLQALRKRGVLRHDRKLGWMLADASD